MEHFWRDFYSEKHSCFLHVRWACGEETKDKLLEIAGTTHKRLVGPKLSRNTPMWAETQKFNFQSEKAFRPNAACQQPFHRLTLIYSH